jgi:hypothetical protein
MKNKLIAIIGFIGLCYLAFRYPSELRAELSDETD